MSAIVALCHFCEVHGPSVIMVTQTDRDCREPVWEGEGGQTTLQQMFGGNIGGRMSQHSHQAGCERCWSLGGSSQHFLVSTERTGSGSGSGRQTYLSSQVALQPEVDSLLRNAVIRAVSCEVPFTREAPLLFSDPTVSTVAAHNFLLRDSKARGFQRYYSIVVLSRERQHLIAHLKSINSPVTQIIEKMKKMSQETYNFETCQSKECPEPSIFRRRASVSSLRNLSEIVGDRTIYEKIHVKFVEILQILEKCLKERVFSGQLMKSSVIFPKASLESVLNIKNEVGLGKFKILLHHVLSGKALQIRSREREISRHVGDSLCMFLPNNLASNQVYFANLILTTTDLGEDIPSLTELTVTTKSPTDIDDFHQSYSVTSELCKCPDLSLFSGCKYCKHINESTIITKLCKKLKNCSSILPTTVQEMTIRSFGESILLQARVFSKLGNQEKTLFLRQNNFTATDAEIFTFFNMFS